MWGLLHVVRTDWIVKAMPADGGACLLSAVFWSALVGVGLWVLWVGLVVVRVCWRVGNCFGVFGCVVDGLVVGGVVCGVVCRFCGVVVGVFCVCELVICGWLVGCVDLSESARQGMELCGAECFSL